MFLIKNLILADQLVKLCALVWLKKTIPIINSFISLELKHNKGISFGIFSNLDPEYINYLKLSILLSITILLLYYMLTRKNLRRLRKIALRIVIAGAMSNFIDRIIYGSVVDMISVFFANIYLFTCNLADVYISFGLLLYIVAPKNKKNRLPTEYELKHKLFKEDNL